MELLRYYSTVFGVTRGRQRLLDLLRLVGLDDTSVHRRKIDLLSGGQKRRASLAAAIVHKPRLIIL